MKFACPKCSTRYSIADEKVPVGKIVKFPCKQCSNVIRLRRRDPNDAGSVESVEAPAAAPAGRPESAPALAGAVTVPVPFESGEKTRVATVDQINEALRSAAVDGGQAPVPSVVSGEATRVVSVEQMSALANASAESVVTTDPVPTSPSPFVAPEAAEWYVLVAGKQKGPIPQAEVEAMLARREIDKRTFVWKNGMASWERLAQVPEFKTLAEQSADASWRVVKPTATEEAAPAEAADGNGSAHAAMVGHDDPTRAVEPGVLDAAEQVGRGADAPQGFYKAETVVAGMDPSAALAGTPVGEGMQREITEDLSGDQLFDQAQRRTDGRATGEAPLTIDEIGEALEGFEQNVSQEMSPPPGGSGMENAEANPDYMNAPPGESTRVFMATAGLYRRRRNHRIAAVLGVTFAVLLIGFVAMDITGIVEIPGMGAVYDIAGVQDPNLDRALERTEHKLAEADLDPTKRAELESLRRKLLGKSQEQKDHGTAGAQRPKDPTAQPAITKQGIEEKPSLDQQQRDMASQLFADARKQEADIKLSDPTAIQTPNLPDGLTQEAIFKVIQENNNSMKLCFAEAARKGEKLAGKMEVQLTIDATGSVTTADVTTQQFKASTMGTCTVKRVKGWKFPRFNGEPVTVVFPYVLTMGM